MGVRDIFPDTIAFVVVVQVADDKPMRVRVLVDLPQRLLFLPAGILPTIGDRLEAFLEQLSEITTCQLAYLKWDRTADLMTEYCEVRILPSYQMQRLHLRFNVVLQPETLISVEELTGRNWIQLRE
jgi:hypothetical protein